MVWWFMLIILSSESPMNFSSENQFITDLATISVKITVATAISAVLNTLGGAPKCFSIKKALGPSLNLDFNPPRTR